VRARRSCGDRRSHPRHPTEEISPPATCTRRSASIPPSASCAVTRSSWKRIKDAGYLAEVCTQQFRIEQEKYSIAILNATDGSDYDLTKAVQKDVMFCGLPGEDVTIIQNTLLESGIYPERIELGSVATLAAWSTTSTTRSRKCRPSCLRSGPRPRTRSSCRRPGSMPRARSRRVSMRWCPSCRRSSGLKDEESARKLFYSNTFDFTGMGPLLIKRLLKELQSSIGFYEVQTGQSVGQVLCTQLSPKLAWLDAAIANALGIGGLRLDPVPWLASRQIALPDSLARNAQDIRWFGLLSLMAHYNSAPANAAVSEEKK